MKLRSTGLQHNITLLNRIKEEEEKTMIEDLCLMIPNVVICAQ